MYVGKGILLFTDKGRWGMNTKQTIERTMILLTLCEKLDTRVTLEYDTGRTTAWDEDKPQQGPRGWRVEVAMQSWEDEDGVEILYPTLEAAANAGLRILSKERAEQAGEGKGE